MIARLHTAPVPAGATISSSTESALHELKALKSYNRKRRHNVGKAERVASGLIGGALLAYGVKRRGIGGAVLGLIGAALVDRGIRGRCALYSALGYSTADPDHTADKFDARVGKEPGEADNKAVPDKVQEASEESFPASDPPSFTGAKA
jgi:hypothetical protein